VTLKLLWSASSRVDSVSSHCKLIADSLSLAFPTYLHSHV
jgi:hypothetical protein